MELKMLLGYIKSHMEDQLKIGDAVRDGSMDPYEYLGYTKAKAELISDAIDKYEKEGDQ